MVANCLVCVGDRGFGGFFCCEQSCLTYMGDCKSTRYTSLRDQYISYKRKIDDDRYDAGYDTADEEEEEHIRAEKVWSRITAVEGTELSYQGDVMREMADNLLDAYLIDRHGYLDLAEELRRMRYYVSKKLFSDLCMMQKENTIKRFNEYVDDRRDNLSTGEEFDPKTIFKDFYLRKRKCL